MPLSKSVGRRPVRVMSCALSCACSSSRCGAYVVQVDGLHAMARVCSRSRPVFRSVRFVTKEQRYGREVQSAAVAEEHNKSQDHHWRKPRVSMEAGSVRAREDRWCDFFFRGIAGVSCAGVVDIQLYSVMPVSNHRLLI
jgi:hypothetical protein